MSYYKIGARTRNHFQSGIKVGAPWVSTPGLIEDEINKLDIDVKSVDRDIYRWLDEHGAFPTSIETGTREGPITEPIPDDVKPQLRFYEGAWSEFLRGWDDFRTDKSSWINRLWGYNYDAVQDWRRKLLAMRASWESIGIDFVGPLPEPPKDTSWGLTSGIRWIAIGAIAIVAGGFLIWILGQVGGRGGGTTFKVVRSTKELS